MSEHNITTPYRLLAPSRLYISNAQAPLASSCLQPDMVMFGGFVQIESLAIKLLSNHNVSLQDAASAVLALTYISTAT